jgi:hypothetical protein
MLAHNESSIMEPPMPCRLCPLFSLLALVVGAVESLPPEWQVRYIRKMSTPQDRPRWETIWLPATNKDRAHIFLKQVRPAAGAVLIGKRIRLPKQAQDLELSATFQTYCTQDRRSGAVDVGVLLPAVWDKLGRDPETASVPVDRDAWVLMGSLHPNRDDVTAWRTRGLQGQELAALKLLAGQEVVLVVHWSTWHAGSDEWFRLADLRLGEPRPWLRPSSWPASARAGEPLLLRVAAWAPKPPKVELGWRQEKDGDWQWLAMAANDDKQYQTELAGETMHKPTELKARMTTADGTAIETAATTITPRQPRVHPCVFYTPEMLVEMRQRVATHDWAKEIADGIIKSAESWKDRADEPPTGPGGWSHDYACPKDGARLKRRDDHPHDHLCRRCKKEWKGPKLDACWRNAVHGRLIGAARNCALAAHLSGKPEYAAFSRRILGWYAKNYRDFPEGRGPAGKGRVMSQSLTECSWLLSAMDAADLTFAYMTEAEKRAVEVGFIEPGVQQISRFRFGIHNIQCWHNACMAAAGYFLGDPAWVARGNEGNLGFRSQVEKGILKDGLWYERSLGYHNYTVSALVRHCEIARNNGEPLHMVGRMPKLFTAPLKLAFPNLVPPSLNDQGYSRGQVGTFALEMAWAWYQDPTAASALRKRYAEGAPRKGLHLLKYGSDLPDGEQYVSPGSVDMSGAGLAILRRGGVRGPCAMLEYGEHGGGHGHPDKLQLILYGLGQVLCPDLGTTGYGVPLHREWYKTTASHNTIAIGAGKQRSTTGKLLGFRKEAAYSAAAAESTGAYPDWRLRRHLLLTDGFLVDVFAVQGKKTDTIDWSLRAAGTATTPLALKPDASKPENKTYGYLKEKRSITTGEQWQCSWQTKRGTLLLTIAGAPDTRITLAKAPGPAGDDPWDTLQVRRQTASTQFVAVYQFLASEDKGQPVRVAGGKIQIGSTTVRLPTAEDPLPVLE